MVTITIRTGLILKLDSSGDLFLCQLSADGKLSHDVFIGRGTKERFHQLQKHLEAMSIFAVDAA